MGRIDWRECCKGRDLRTNDAEIGYNVSGGGDWDRGYRDGENAAGGGA